jgi:hypothetical protein
MKTRSSPIQSFQRGCCQEKHGVYGVHARKKYSDCRTREGKQLRDIVNGIVSDLGGKASLTTAQKLILNGIRSKLIVTQQISHFIDGQATGLVSAKGEIASILQTSFYQYSEGIRRDLETLYLMKRTTNHSDYERAVKNLGGKE